MGLNIYECDPFLLSFSFESCLLSFSSFSRLKIKNTSFKDCKLIQADFSETDLTSADFTNCDLSGAIFYNTRLQKADFATSQNFSIDPEINDIKEAKFSLENIPGLLEKHKIKII
ncbi:pentapeptide repeat-containing protein [Salinimicrobium sediminilitoris]|uniref:pentapeptide repeat-containing protein n=1 Tax=Salinimicrobium sediminilitoris TaxID=2876715 RepID=UPI001E568077